MLSIFLEGRIKTDMEEYRKNSVGFFALLFLLFLGLKLAHFITWSWWWVTSPLWAGPAILLVVAAIAVIVICLKTSCKKRKL